LSAVAARLLAITAVVSALVPGAVLRPAGAEETRKLCTIRDSRIPESSGLAASRRHPGTIYTFNDSGNLPRIYALGQDCRVKAVLTVGGAQNRDWEAMAIGPGGLYIGDIGDNLNGAWPYVTVYRIPEPATLRTQTLRATAYRVKYAAGARNAESMMINPRTGRLYIASKEFGGSLYEGPKRLSTSGFNVMHRVAGAPLYATDAAYAPDGRTFVIRTYWGATIYTAPGKTLADVDIPTQKQGEGITFTADGRSLLASSEGVNQALWQVPVPDSALPKTTAKTRGSTAAPAEVTDGAPKKRSLFLPAMIGLGVVFAGALMFARRRRS
jgi:hypothetical protein